MCQAGLPVGGQAVFAKSLFRTTINVAIFNFALLALNCVALIIIRNLNTDSMITQNSHFKLLNSHRV